MRPTRILLIEDDPADLLLTRRALSQTPLQVGLSVVTSSAMAQEHLYRRGNFADAVRPDLILLDLSLPDDSGLSLLKIIKSDPALTIIPVIALTAPDTDVARAYALQASSCVCKPADLDSFITTIEAIAHFWLTVARLPP
ncbi:MAG: chemotaxis family two-component system response regulator Rcp1 [Myxococcota bacterium]|jgi:chemotaxis family two-component system response regulator Rcp1